MFFSAWWKNLKVVRHFDRLHWGWSIVIYNCNSYPCPVGGECVTVWQQSTGSSASRKKQNCHESLTHGRVTTSSKAKEMIGSCALPLSLHWGVYSNLSRHIKECQNSIYYLNLSNGQNLKSEASHVKSNNAQSLAYCDLLDGRRTIWTVHSSTENRIDWDLRVDIGS